MIDCGDTIIQLFEERSGKGTIRKRKEYLITFVFELGC